MSDKDRDILPDKSNYCDCGRCRYETIATESVTKMPCYLCKPTVDGGSKWKIKKSGAKKR